MDEEREIIVDDYYPDHPHIVWSCDHCGGWYPVAAQFETGAQSYITLCAPCLRRGLDGIQASLDHPMKLEE